MIEIGLALSIATSAFNGIKKAIDAGRDAQDIASVFGKFFDAKDQITEAGQYSDNQPIVKKLFSGSSVEAQALQITAAKHKTMQLEKELREYLIWSGQGAFYEDMMEERRKIRQARLAAAKRKAETKKFWIDVLTVGLALVGTVTALIFILIKTVGAA